MKYTGRVFRPPSEAYSLIVQATIGCSHNKCAFCQMYKEKKFCVRPIEEVFDDLAGARRAYPVIERVFLADGDALILPQEHLLRILHFIREKIPECRRVGIYSAPRSIKPTPLGQLTERAEAGLHIAYLGLESGNEQVLARMNKGETVSEIIEAGRKVKAAGIALSLTAINGLGGAEMSREHAIDTAKAVSAIKPDYVALLTLRVYTGTPLADWVEEESFTLMDPVELARESRLFLEHVDSEGSVFRSNHASNYLPLAGTLNADREKMIAQLDAALAGKRRFRSQVELGF